MSARVVSLFAGIGGFDLGFEQAGFTVVAQVEKDEKCRELLAAKWPDSAALDDVCTAGEHNLPACDVITFGFPCQDLSVAGKRAGLAGERSGLFFEATRIIYELKPTYCLFENVPGLLTSSKGEDFERVLCEMERIGYCGSWRLLDAQWIGVAQRRRRVFGLFSNLDSGAERCAEILSLQESLRGHPAPSREAQKDTSSESQGGAGTGCTGNAPPELDFCTTPSISESFTASSFGGYKPGVGTLRSHGGDLGGGSETLVIPAIVNTLTCRMQGSSGWAPYNETEHLVPDLASGGMVVRRLTPTECERLQGFPVGWTEGFLDSTRYKMLGNAVCVNVAEWIARRMAVALEKTDGTGETIWN